MMMHDGPTATIESDRITAEKDPSNNDMTFYVNNRWLYSLVEDTEYNQTCDDVDPSITSARKP
jgi:hypothetical protein